MTTIAAGPPARLRGEPLRNEHLTFRANTDAGRHGWLRLTPAYGVGLVRERVARLEAGAVVTDPFSGSGTTPLAAAEAGHLGQSLDVNPFLIWLGTAKTRAYPAGVAAETVRLAAEVVGSAAGLLTRDDLWRPALHAIERWWSPGVLRGLCALRAALDDAAPEGAHRDLLLLALCRTLISRSEAAFNHQSMSFSAPKSASPRAFDPAEATGTLEAFTVAAAELAAQAAVTLPGRAVVVQADSRSPEAAALEPCDLLLTSPPYVNRMSYIRELRPYMYWLGHLEVAADAGELDWRAIGGTWGAATSKLNGWEPSGCTPVDGAMEPVCRAVAEAGGKHGPLLATYVHKYFHDMWRHLSAVPALVRPGGHVSYVVGNSSFYGQLVPAQEWYAAMLRAAGFDEVAVHVLRKRNSNKALFEYEVTGVRP
ncbi:DNA methyltransferase [Spongisporangium articulatum]|uniref:site-specific DNA-methyltransferase (cytosine-N(4)-specific) n=1 Tax=Spongisporangium articulatum TaxID=3362603 RepID=A0ABW8AI44_9ACTN